MPQFGRHLDQQRLAQTGQIIERQVSRLIATGVDFSSCLSMSTSWPRCSAGHDAALMRCGRRHASG
ncbi:hypothetical protein CR105_25145 [Massilia eurypsychrophila]|uniref:Uncharacterized protein n=1 Tax=Massilia eurypsychrophila TaxID=1485217 RepID=A0A2G8T9B7_9BURK|nr:hypothetical protein CR105_25145 [Massilia eurypsychrophila]